MQRSVFHINYSWADLKPIRPAVIIVGAFQLLGAGLGYLYLGLSNWFDNLWFGGAFTTLPGAILGICFLYMTRADSIKANRLMCVHFLLVASTLTIVGLLMFQGKH